MDLKQWALSFQKARKGKSKGSYAKENKYADHLWTCGKEHRSWTFETEFIWVKGKGKSSGATETHIQIPSLLHTYIITEGKPIKRL